MLLTALLGLACAHASPAPLVRLEAHQVGGERAATARALADAPGFDRLVVDDLPAGWGRTLRVYGVLDGVRTQDPLAVVRFDPTDTPRLVRRWPHAAPSPTGPGLSEATLEARVQALTQQVPGTLGPLRWHAHGEHLVAARRVGLDRPWRGLRHPSLLVHAETGALLALVDDTTTGLGHTPDGEKVPQADVYPIDPVRTPALERVELPASTRHALHSAHFQVHNCTDLGTTYRTGSDLGEVDLRWCEAVAPVPPDGGQWVVEPTPWPLDPALDEDAFAGPSLLWHGEATLADLIDLGLPLPERPAGFQRLEALTNLRTTDLRDRTTMADPTAPLAPYDNAYFRRGRETSDGTFVSPELVFGQGSAGDFAYDADVIIHELGHFAVWTQGGPSSVRGSVHGSSAEPGALNEGLADYFAAIRTGDPEIGTYSGESLGRPYIRTLAGDARCPDDVYGQVHADSQPFSQALWQARTTLDPALQPLLDRSVVDALPLMGSTGDFAVAVESVVAEVELQVGPDAAADLADAFHARAVDACLPHVPVVSGATARSYTLVPAFYDDLYEGTIPGYVQFVVDADGPLEVTITFVQTESTEVDLWTTHVPADVPVLVHSGGPIEHSGETDATLGEYVWASNARVAGWAVRTDTLDASLDGRTVPHVYTATLRLDGPGPHYLQLGNQAERSVVAREVAFSWTTADADDDTGEAGAAPSKSPETGCSSLLARADGGAGLLILVGALAAARRERLSLR